MSNLAAIILAGGQSKRMGRDKAFLLWKDKPFIQHLIDAVLPLTRDVYFSGKSQKLKTLGFEVIADEIENAGPVVALASCFNKIKAKSVLVLSCDVPQIATKDLKELIAVNTPEYDAVFYTFNGKAMPLAGIYNQSCFSVFIAEMQAGERKLFNVLDKLKTKEIEYKCAGGLQNINTPHDLKLLR